jgi:hypothetical protein
MRLVGQLDWPLVRCFRPDSDIHVLININPEARFSLVDLVSVKIFLEERLGRETDVDVAAAIGDLRLAPSSRLAVGWRQTNDRSQQTTTAARASFECIWRN